MTIFEIPIITYHKISPQKEFGLTTISPEVFSKQIDFLYQSGYQAITFEEYSKNPDNCPQKPIIISFDDTYQCVNEYAFPIMKERNFKGVLFVLADYIGKYNTWEAFPVQRKFKHADNEEIIEMAEYGFEIASHGLTHSCLPYLSSENISNEVNESKSKLEKLFRKKLITFCYPYGKYSKKVISRLQKSDYKFATSNINFDTLSNYTIKRRSIYSSDSFFDFSDKIMNHNKLDKNYFKEWIIQTGAYAGILKNKFSHHN